MGLVIQLSLGGLLAISAFAFLVLSIILTLRGLPLGLAGVGARVEGPGSSLVGYSQNRFWHMIVYQ